MRWYFAVIISLIFGIANLFFYTRLREALAITSKYVLDKDENGKSLYVNGEVEDASNRFIIPFVTSILTFAAWFAFFALQLSVGTAYIIGIGMLAGTIVGYNVKIEKLGWGISTAGKYYVSPTVFSLRTSRALILYNFISIAFLVLYVMLGVGRD